MEELDETARTTPYDHPVIATLAGAAVLIIGALLLPRFAAQQPLAILLGAGAGLASLLWAIGFAATTLFEHRVETRLAGGAGGGGARIRADRAWPI